MSLPAFLANRELPSRDPLVIRRMLLGDLAELAGADAGLFYKVGRREGESILRTAAVLVTGRGEVVEHFERIEGMAVAGGEMILEHQTEIDRLTPQWREDMPDFVRQDFWDPVGVHSSLGMNVARDNQHICFFGVLRARPTPEFEQDAGLALGPRSLAYGDLLYAAELLESAELRGRALFVVSRGAEITFASPVGLELLERRGFKESLLGDVRDLSVDGEAIDSRAATWLGGASLHVYPVQGPAGRAYVAILEPVEKARIEAIHLLSATKRKIATAAAAGATVSEIARSLHRGPETIRSHLSEIYARLGIGSRAELAIIVREAWR